MGSSEDALYFQTQYNGLSVGHYLRYPSYGRLYHPMRDGVDFGSKLEGVLFRPLWIQTVEKNPTPMKTIIGMNTISSCNQLSTSPAMACPLPTPVVFELE
jgi:hypothetical protein